MKEYHPNGKEINHENPRHPKKCPKCKSRNTIINGHVRDCLFCGNLWSI